jgi:PiT family inorganic phosphate transporter
MDGLIYGAADPMVLVALVAALGLALAFEFVNGFHDTANAVATVIYTHTLRPGQAVLWSGVWNFIGVLTSSGAVAFGIVALLPLDLVLHVGADPVPGAGIGAGVGMGAGAGFAMIFALLLSALLWNLGTWYFGLPASSSQALIGSIVGVGLMNSALVSGDLGGGVHWASVGKAGLAMLISPLIGFGGSALLILAGRAIFRRTGLPTTPPTKGQPPPRAARALLILTCTGVSFAHGSNDGQKGMGLIMLILLALLPAAYSLDLSPSAGRLAELAAAAQVAEERLASAVSATEARGSAHRAPALTAHAARDELEEFLHTGAYRPATLTALHTLNASVGASLRQVRGLVDLKGEERRDLRLQIALLATTLEVLAKRALPFAAAVDRQALSVYARELSTLIHFLPTWVKAAVALALSLGTMIGWRRVVVTVGERIGKSHLTYAQGASAESVAAIAIAIGLADAFGLPVSTTHVLSSGVAGTMVACRSGVQGDTLRNILLAWILTLPVCMLLGAGLFGAALLLLFQV